MPFIKTFMCLEKKTQKMRFALAMKKKGGEKNILDRAKSNQK